MKNSSNYEKKYKKILKKCLKKGIYRYDRTGVGSLSIFDVGISVNVSKKFPLLTGRKMFPKTFNTEFEWFINGETNIKRFKDAGVKIWDAWADENGDLGPVYGYQMRNFNGEHIDQLESVISSLKHNKDSRRHIISLWNPIQLNDMKLPPCYLYFQFFVDYKNKLNMFVLQRSGDLFLGIPYDIALFTKILLYVAEQTGLSANKLSLRIIDAHIYSNQHAAIKEYLKQVNYKLPTYIYKDKELTINNYEHGPIIKAEVAV
jgi:thymidylate synthase